MKKTLLTIVAALLLGGVVNAQGWGETDSHAKSSNTPIVASVTLDGNAVTPTADYRLGAFVGEELRGLAAPHMDDNNFWIQVFYNQGTTEEITFKLWDPTGEGTELTDYTLTYGDLTALTTQEEGWGTPSEPVALDFATTQTMTQTSTLATGWTWWSTPIEMENNNGLQQLENSISQYGVTIKSKTASVVKRGNTWQGSLTALTNEQMYKINVSNVSSSSITGAIANPTDHVITINPGWNWIGYPVTISQSVSSALSGFQPAAGDVIKNLGGSAMYRGTQWVQPSYTLTPGSGYMYYSNASVSKQLVFSVNRGEAVDAFSNETFWIANNSKYENNMVLIAVVLLGENEQRDETLELGAFVDGECTGSSKLFYVEEDDRYYTIMTIGGCENDRITFGLVNTSKDIIYNNSNNSLTFSNDAIVGDFENPYKVCFNTLGIGETTMQVAMYPNPVNRGETFKLNIPQGEEVIDITIVNAIGTVVRHDVGALKSTVSGLSVAGVYTVKVTCRSGNSYYGRLIVK